MAAVTYSSCLTYVIARITFNTYTMLYQCVQRI